ncbi:transcription factor Cys6 [Beauveria brongniartii RCEF 3172]|uniref:Transcription factor Cys6 n=1 Tax=Beauveria brongniartii RCEF 3172 TaxID=1081107 RepID=A0A166YAU8_9HYPO|nr:transcription factor Cys6 [Beauveria brongniartii RCEF 3172]
MASAKPGSGQRFVESPFAAIVNQGLTLFKSLVTGLEHDTVHRSLAISHAAKFKLWAGSLGAHRSSGSRSLMYRLRDASFIRNHILSLLQDLCESLNEAVSLITESDTPPVSKEAPDATLEELAEYFHDGETEQEDEIDAVMKSIGYEINCLLRLSVTIRNPAPHDQFKSRAGAEIVQHFKHWDLQHVKAKFPDANGNIQERLAEATSRRRQYLKYREEHTARLAEGLDEDAALTVADPIEGATTLASSLPDHLKGFQSIPEPLMNDNISEASGTSYATSVSSIHRLRVPPFPAEHEDGPVKCPFCHMFIPVRDRSEWKRHVFRDLQPYICLRDDCSAPDHLYARRAHWMEHMKAEHWRVWHCIFGCPGTFDSKKELQAHLHATHGQESSGAKLVSLESPSGRADVGKIREKCPLCASFWCESVQKYEQHIGRHLEDLALFVLPSTGDDKGSDESEIEEDIRAVGDGDVVAGTAKSDYSTGPMTEWLQAGVDQDGVPESRHFDQDQPLNSKFRRLPTDLSKHLDITIDEFGAVFPPQQPGSTSQGTDNDALRFVDEVKNRLINQPRAYYEFLMVMQTWIGGKTSLEDIYPKIAMLFKSEPDLVEKFHQFLFSLDSNSKEEQKVIWQRFVGRHSIKVRVSTCIVQDGTEITLSQASRVYQDENERGLLREVTQADDDGGKDALASVTRAANTSELPNTIGS